MGRVSFSLSHFIPDGEENLKYHYFYFLSRWFFDREGFPGHFTKRDFLREGAKKGFSEGSLVRIWKEGSGKGNPFLRREANVSKTVFLKSPRSLTEPRTVRITGERVFKSVKCLPDFRCLCFAVVAAMPSKMKKEDATQYTKTKSRTEYTKGVRSRTLATIGSRFGLENKSAVSKILKRAKEKFSFFNATSRFITYNGLICRISNIYTIRGIEYGYSAEIRRKIENNTVSRDVSEWTTVIPPDIRRKRMLFGERITDQKRKRDEGTLYIPRERYEEAYKNFF